MRALDLISAMRVYIRVVERGSISEAARDLDMGQSTVSERINRLEQHLGVPLLFRHARTLTCTDDGELFYARSKAAVEAVDEALAIAQEHRDIRGTFRIAAPQGLGEIVLPPVLADIRTRYPELHIDLILNDTVVDPVTEGVDISLRLGRPIQGKGSQYQLGQVRRALVAAPAYLARHPGIVEPRMLAQHPFIRVRGVYGDRELELIDGNGATITTPLTVAMTVGHWRPARELLIAGIGIGVLQEPACKDALNDGRLQRILPGYTVPSFELRMVLPVTRPIPSKTRAIVKILEERLPVLLEKASL